MSSSDSRLKTVRGMAAAPRRLLDNSQRQLLREGAGWAPPPLPRDRSPDRSAAGYPSGMEIPGLIPEAAPTLTPTRPRFDNRQMPIEAFADRRCAGTGHYHRIGGAALVMYRGATHDYLRPRARGPFLAWSEASNAPSYPTDVRGSTTTAGKLVPVDEQVPAVFRSEGRSTAIRRTAWAEPEVVMPTTFQPFGLSPSVRRECSREEDTGKPTLLRRNLPPLEPSSEWDGTEDEVGERPLANVDGYSPMPNFRAPGAEHEERGDYSVGDGEDLQDEMDEPALVHILSPVPSLDRQQGAGYEVASSAPQILVPVSLGGEGAVNDEETPEAPAPLLLPTVSLQREAHDEIEEADEAAPSVHVVTSSTAARPLGVEERLADVERVAPAFRRPSSPAPAAFITVYAAAPRTEFEAASKRACGIVQQGEGGDEHPPARAPPRPSTPPPAAFIEAYRRARQNERDAANRRERGGVQQGEGGDESAANMPAGCGALKPFKAVCRAIKAVCRPRK
ncbi:hypothetical protein PLESTB_001548500 [Pleodorina starrii]|uniref:Uncharacterized protein n=1 Tax=Pleodorina starrii TaxID=330485 RepID=A0A9W6F8S6_9CHLO|nr:hypothetical protein PLESTB_001548500 [Pleodorina starrii]